MKQHVDIGRQHLFADQPLRLLARELGPALQHLDDRQGVLAQHHPVAHRRPQSRGLAQRSGHACLDFAALGPHQETPMVGRSHAPWDARRELACKELVPSELFKKHGDHPLLDAASGRTSAAASQRGDL